MTNSIIFLVWSLIPKIKYPKSLLLMVAPLAKAAMYSPTPSGIVIAHYGATLLLNSKQVCSSFCWRGSSNKLCKSCSRIKLKLIRCPLEILPRNLLNFEEWHRFTNGINLIIFKREQQRILMRVVG